MKTETVSMFCGIKNKTVSVSKEIFYENGRNGELGERILRCFSDDEECGVLDCRYSKYIKTKGIGDVGKEPFDNHNS